MKENNPNSIHLKKLTTKPTYEDYLEEYKRNTKLDETRPLIQNIFKYLRSKAVPDSEIDQKTDMILKKIEEDLEKDKNLSYEEVVKRINESHENNNPKPPQE